MNPGVSEIDLLFASDSIWNWEAEKNFARLRDENGLGATTATARDIENVSSRKPSVAQDKQVQVESVQS